MSNVQKFAVGDDVKIYEWSPDVNKSRIRIGQVSSMVFRKPLDGCSQLYLDIKIGDQIVGNVPASTVKHISDPFYEIGDHVRLLELPTLGRHSQIGNIINYSIDESGKRISAYKIKAIDGTIWEEISEEALNMISFNEYEKACEEYRKRPPAIYAFDTEPIYDCEKDAWIKTDKDRICGKRIEYMYCDDETAYVDPNKISDHFDLFMKKERNNNMPTFSDLAADAARYTISTTGLGSITFDGGQHSASYSVQCGSGLPSIKEKETAKEPEKKRETKAPYHYIPVAYKVKRIIYNDPATIVFWSDNTKTVVKRGPTETFNKYTAFCAALAKKMYGNNSRVNKIVNGGEDQTSKNYTKNLTERILHLRYKQHMSVANIASKLDISKEMVSGIIQANKKGEKK